MLSYACDIFDMSHPMWDEDLQKNDYIFSTAYHGD